MSNRNRIVHDFESSYLDLEINLLELATFLILSLLLLKKPHISKQTPNKPVGRLNRV